MPFQRDSEIFKIQRPIFPYLWKYSTYVHVHLHIDDPKLNFYTYAHMYFKTTMYLHSFLLHDSRLRSLPNVFKNSKQFQLCLNSSWDEFCYGDCKITWKSRWIIKWLTVESCFVVCQECCCHFQILWVEGLAEEIPQNLTALH